MSASIRLVFKYAKEPELGGLELEVSVEKTLQDISTEIVRARPTHVGPFRFVHKGVLRSPFVALKDIEDMKDGDIVIYADQVRTPIISSPVNLNPQQASPNAIAANTPTITRMLSDPIMQMVMNSPDLMAAIFENNPQIQALRKSNPQINAILSDPKEMIELMRNLSNPATAREMFKASDRALSNADAAIGGMDAIRSLYNDYSQVFDNSDNDEGCTARHCEPKKEIEEAPFPRGGGSAVASAQNNLSDSQFYPELELGMYPGFAEMPGFASFIPPARGGFGGDFPGLPPAPNIPLFPQTDFAPQFFEGIVPNRQTDEPDPRELYQNQIRTLQGMGFDDIDKVIQALKHSNGIINGALDFLTRST